MRLLPRLSGDDIFISYSRSDGSLYAAGLADKLTEKNFSCFIDRFGVPPGHDLPPKLVKRIKSCSAMVIIGTEKAARSEFVRKEIAIFDKTRRTILPIDFDQNIGRAIWYEDIPGLASESEKDPLALERGDPSQNVINFIEKSFNYSRRNQRMARTFWATAAAFLILIALGAGSLSVVLGQVDEARKNADTAILEAETSREQARVAREEAAAEATRAKSESERANSEANRAKQQTELADAKTKEAAEKTTEAEKAEKLANEQTRKAEAAEDQRIAAQKKASEQEIQASISLAEKYYNTADTEARMDPMRALPWLEKALDTIPKSDRRFDIYKLKALHLAKFGAQSLTNTNIYHVSNSLFSPKLDKVFLRTISSAQFWDLKKGVSLPLPTDSTTGRPVRLSNPAFSPDGKWASTFSAELFSPNTKTGPPCLHVWEIENPQNHFEKCDARFEGMRGGGLIGLYLSPSHGYVTPFFHFSSDSRYVILNLPPVQGKETKVLIWEISTREEIAHISSDLLLKDESKKSTASSGTAAEDKGPEDDENEVRANIQVSKNPEANLLITVKNQETGTIAEIRDVSNVNEIKKPIPLERFVDFIKFTGKADKVVTISHDPGKKRILRVWDAASGAVLKAMEDFSLNIAAVNNTGSKLVLESDDLNTLTLYDINTSLSQDISINPVSSFLAWFTDDDKYFVTYSREKFLPNSSPTGYDLNLWSSSLNGFPASLVNIKNISDNFGLSDSYKRASYISNDGVISSLPLIRAEAPLERLIALPEPSDLTGYVAIYPSADLKTFVIFPPSKDIFGVSEMQSWNVDWDQKKTTNKWRKKLADEISYTTMWLYPRSGSFSSNGKYFVLLQQSALNRSYYFTISETGNEKDVKNVAFNKEEFVHHVAFDRTGLNVIAAFSKFISPGNIFIEFRRWNHETGEEVHLPFPKLKVDRYPSPSCGFTRYGEYLINYSDFTSDFFWISATDGSQTEARKVGFSSNFEANLAVLLLNQAERITWENGNLVAMINPDLFIELKISENATRIINKKTGQSIIAPRRFFSIAKISPNGRFLAVKALTTEVWDTETGLLIADHLDKNEYIVFLDFAPDGSFVTASSKGRIRSMVIGDIKKGTPAWLSDIGRALSGMEIGGLDLTRIPQDRFVKIRNDYFKRLREAADAGDVEAKYILDKLSP